MKNTFLLIIGLFGFGFSGMAQTDVVWTDLVNVTATGNSLSKSGGGNGWNAGAASTTAIPANADGWVEFTTDATNSTRMFGLSEVNADETHTTINYAIFAKLNGDIRISENGSPIGTFGTYSNGNVLRVERQGSTIVYKKNGNVLYTSTAVSTTELYVDCSLYSSNASINNAVSYSDDGSGGGTPGSSLWSEAASGTDIYYNTGNVGIGNDAPNSLLHITTTAATDKGFTIESGGATNFQIMGDGRVFAREVEVTLNNFPDYVFAKDYSLMPLGQLKKYIETNQHLPNIPSAKEVEENGMGMGELNLKQVEKIEELTLYILQLDERLQKLEAENAVLQQEIERK